MDKYRRVDKPKDEVEIKENEIRITTQGKMKNYITYALALLNQEDESKPTHRSLVLKAMGRAINKTVSVCEIIKHRVQGLHQTTAIDSSEIVDVWEPLEEGLKTVTNTRRVSSITIYLSKDPLDINDPGYQHPIDPSEVKEAEERTPGGRGGGRGRGFRRGGRRGGRGRGRGGRGRGNFRNDGEEGGNFRKDGEEGGNFRKDGEERRNFRKDGEERRNFRKDGEERRNFRKDGEERRNFRKDGEERRNFRKDGEDDRRRGGRGGRRRGGRGRGRGGGDRGAHVPVQAAPAAE